MSIYLLLFLCIVSVCAANDYDTNNTDHCAQINSSDNLTQNLRFLWNKAILRDADRYAFLIGSPIILILQSVLIFAICKYQVYRSSPMDIVLACFISEFFINLCYFATAIYYTANPINLVSMPQSFPIFCLTTAIINTISSMLEKLYLLIFLIVIVSNVKKSIKKNKWIQASYKHIIPIILCLIAATLIGIFNGYGLTQFGFCSTTSLRTNKTQLYFPIFQLLFSIIFIFLAIFAYRYFKRYMPEGVALNRRKYQQNQLMTRFVVGMSIFLAIFTACILTVYLNCLDPDPFTLVLATIFNISRLCQFLYLILVMFFYNKIGNKVKKLFRTLFSKSNVSSSVFIRQKRLTQKQLFDIIDIGIKQKILDIQQQQNQIDFIRITQVMTILTGIKISYKEYMINEVQNINDLKNLYFHEQISFQIGPQLIKQYQQQATILPRLSLLKGKFTIYAPKVFSRILIEDNVTQIWKSFELMENSNQLYQIVQADGGKSGQFFFFTSDNKYILKTINNDEFTFLEEYLEDFYSHFLTYEKTLISKIYGMFKIENREVDQSYFILLMKNTAGCERKQIQRVYDMKGSTDDRQILKETQYTDTQLVKNVVLKDLDFLKLQHQLQVDQIHAKQLRNQLKIDTQFLRDLNIIDYSLLVMRVRWEEPAPQPHFWKKLNRISSTIDPKQFYHISLIDYLQKWDFQKKSQKWWKNLFGKKDVSSQQPSVYQFRFMKFLKEITAGDSNRVTRERISRQKSHSQSNQHTQLVRITDISQRLQKQSFCIQEAPRKEASNYHQTFQ